MKKILCILMTLVTFMVSISTVWGGDFQNEPQTVLVSSQTIVLDEEYSAEITDYEYLSEGLSVYAVTSQKTYSRMYRIYRTSDGATMVKWTLTGYFTYNGSTSTCTNATIECDNYSPSTYTITNKSRSWSGCYAYGYCGAINNETGKIYSHTIQFGVDPDGNII